MNAVAFDRDRNPAEVVQDITAARNGGLTGNAMEPKRCLQRLQSVEWRGRGYPQVCNISALNPQMTDAAHFLVNVDVPRTEEVVALINRIACGFDPVLMSFISAKQGHLQTLTD